MRKSRFSEEQIIAILREQEAGARTEEVCRRHGVSGTTFYKWKARYGGLEVSEARRLKALEDENRRLKKLLAEAVLDVAALKDLLARMYGPPRLARLKMMCELALQQCIRRLASGLVSSQAVMRSARRVPEY
jgi:putative transposase